MWFWLALASAVLGAIDIILNKKVLHKVSPAILSWSLFALTLPILFFLALVEGIPAVNLTFWVAIILASITFAVGKNILNDALKNNLVSQIIPLTAFSGVFIYIFGLIILSESIKPIPLVGLLMVIIGAYILNVEQAKEDVLKPFKLLFSTRGSLLVLLAIVITSSTAIFDKMGVINTTPKSPIFTVFLENILMSTLLTIYLLSRERKTWVMQIRNNFRLLFINSLVYLAIAYIVFVAYGSEGPVALVIGIKRLQIFFALFLGYLFLKDKPGKYTWIGTVVMILGVILIKLG